MRSTGMPETFEAIASDLDVSQALWSFLTAEEAGEQEMSCFRECKIDSA